MRVAHILCLILQEANHPAGFSLQVMRHHTTVLFTAVQSRGDMHCRHVCSCLAFSLAPALFWVRWDSFWARLFMPAPCLAEARSAHDLEQACTSGDRHASVSDSRQACGGGESCHHTSAPVPRPVLRMLLVAAKCVAVVATRVCAGCNRWRGLQAAASWPWRPNGAPSLCCARPQ